MSGSIADRLAAALRYARDHERSSSFDFDHWRELTDPALAEYDAAQGDAVVEGVTLPSTPTSEAERLLLAMVSPPHGEGVSLATQYAIAYEAARRYLVARGLLQETP